MTDTIVQGRAAWHRLRDRERATWQDWLTVGEALIIGRTLAMQTAQTNKPSGSTYNRAMGHWLASNGFDQISNQERYRAIVCVENREAIEKWRETLEEAHRRRLNHPNAVWFGWRKSLRPAEAPSPRQHVVKGVKTHREDKPIYWPQDAIRRAATAMRESMSSDLFVLARVGLEAAIRDEHDLLELLPAPKRPPVRSTSVEMALAS
jgi:hypothetical protein